MNRKKVVITGGSGFIGTHLIKRLFKDDAYDITVIDTQVPKVDGVSFVQSDFCDFKKIEPYLIGVDCLIHLAAVLGVDNCNNNPDKVQKTNYCDTKEFIDLCVAKKVKRFIFSSSSEIYGNSKDIPYMESNMPEPFSLYAKNKLEIEKYLKAVSSEMSIGIARFFNVYGPSQRNNFVVSIFIEAALNNREINIFGNGSQSRCFTYVEDAVDGVVMLIKYDKAPFEIVNIGNPVEVSINKLAEIILKHIPESRSEIVFRQYGNDIRESALEITRRVPSVEKAKSLLGFVAKVDLDTGISLTIKHYEK